MDLRERFLAKIQEVDGHWLWTGATDRDGYGRIAVFREDGVRFTVQAHRVSYRLFKGPLAERDELDHTCQVRGCVCPDHLDAVTHKVNCERKPRRTHCFKGHEYTEDTTYTRPNGRRECLICTKSRRSAKRHATTGR